MKSTYDLVFGIGYSCRTSMALRNAGLQYSSFPMDWVIGGGIVDRMKFLVSGFEGWLPESELEELPAETADEHRRVRDRVSRVEFVHDFSLKCSVAEDLQRVRDHYLRRISRLLGKIESSERVLIVWIDSCGNEPVTLEQLRECRRMVRARWPGKRVDFLAFSNRPGYGDIAVDVAEEDGIVFAVGTHREYCFGKDFLPYERWLRRRYAAVDYRTEADKSRWRELCRERRYARVGARGPLDYVFAKLEWKLYRHFLKRMAARGVIG